MSTIELTTENFNETVNSDKIVLVDFWATWCGPCRQFGPIFESVSEKHPDIVSARSTLMRSRNLLLPHRSRRSRPDDLPRRRPDLP